MMYCCCYIKVLGSKGEITIAVVRSGCLHLVFWILLIHPKIFRGKEVSEMQYYRVKVVAWFSYLIVSILSIL